MSWTRFKVWAGIVVGCSALTLILRNTPYATVGYVIGMIGMFAQSWVV